MSCIVLSRVYIITAERVLFLSASALISLRVLIVQLLQVLRIVLGTSFHTLGTGIERFDDSWRLDIPLSVLDAKHTLGTAHLSSLIPGTLDEIDVRVVSYNGSNEIVYFPEDFNVFKVVFNDVINAVRMPGPGSLPLFFQYWSFTVNSKEFSEACQSIACEFKVIPSRSPPIHRGDSGEGR